MSNIKNENEELQAEFNPADLSAEVASLKEEKMVLLAKIENDRKAHLRDTEEVVKYANKKIILKVLPLLENYERALKISESQPDSTISKFMSGFEMILESLKSSLKSEGVSEYVPELKKDLWDSRFCDVIDEVVDDSCEAGVVLEVLQKGYLLNGRVLITAKVTISKKSAVV